jgi:hypothetical protein
MPRPASKVAAVDPSPTEKDRPAVARANAGRVAAFLAVLALTAAGGWQAGRVFAPAPPPQASLPATTFTHGHP